MDSREAIEILEEVAEFDDSMYAYNPAYNEALQLAIAALEKLEAIKNNEPPTSDWECYSDRLYDAAYKRGKQEQDGWISAKERLPEKDCRCRVTEGNFKAVIDCNWNNHEKRFEVWSYYRDDYVPITNVTAWKLIEAPYTEEEI